jgi:hypothetical protein
MELATTNAIAELPSRASDKGLICLSPSVILSPRRSYYLYFHIIYDPAGRSRKLLASVRQAGMAASAEPPASERRVAHFPIYFCGVAGLVSRNRRFAAPLLAIATPIISRCFASFSASP